MKKFRIFTLAALAAISMSAMAQVYDYEYYDHQYQPTRSTIYGSDNDAFGLFYVQYNAVTEHATITNHDSENESNSAVSLGYSYYIPLGDIPLFFSPGVAAQWFFDSEKEDGIETKSNMISAKIPINLVYSLQVSDGFRIEPYAGIYGRINIWGQIKETYRGVSETFNLFDKDDMGDVAFKRFQFGWNAGLNFRITDAFTIGAGYFMDLTKIISYSKGKHDVKGNFQGFDITLGVNF